MTATEIAAAAREAAAGAAIVHVHVRDEEGRPSADVEVARRVKGEIEAACAALVQAAALERPLNSPAEAAALGLTAA